MEEHSKVARPRGTDCAKVIQVIETRSLAGAGLPGDPVRELVQYWSFEGEKLAQRDSYLETGG